MPNAVMMPEPTAAAPSLASAAERCCCITRSTSFNNAYAAALDDQRLCDWVEMFTEEAEYVVLSRENFDRKLPVGLIYCENKG